MGVDMDWEALGAIAELFGAIAVFCTLIYLTIQVRQNANAIEQQTRVATAQMMQSRGDTLTNFFSLGINDDKALAIFAEIFQKADLESTREWIVVNTARAMWENLFYQYKEGYLPESYYNQGVATGIRLAGPKFLELGIPMQDDFREEVLRLLATQEGSRGHDKLNDR